MAELMAKGERDEDHWRRTLPEQELIVLSRDGDGWTVPWEKWISRHHAELTWSRDVLSVRQLDSARNPIYFRGRESRAFELRGGECFVIGCTVFQVHDENPAPRPEINPVLQVRTVGEHELERIPFRDAPHRIDVLNQLPRVIASATDDTELFIQLVNLLLASIQRADAIAIVSVSSEADDADVVVLHVDERRSMEGEFRPSHRLVREALNRVKRTVLHVWASEGDRGAESGYTLQGNFDWAFCTPVPGDACKGWGIYVVGRLAGDAASTILAPWDSNELGDDVKFTELVAAILSSLRQVRKLQRDQAQLSQFFSPAVQRVLTAEDPEQALKPRETDVTVLFCDLRGFSRKVEKSAENLLAVLDRVSLALGVMTQNILDYKGVIADFLGDAALGFWGWPLSQPDMVQQACLAALGIRSSYEEFARKHDHPLSEFRVGIGVATGRAVAGRIGSLNQSKVTVFGPVVNLASRLEGMTKLLRVPILLDEATAQVVKEQMPPELARCRRLAVVRPFGLTTPLTVSELLMPASTFPSLSNSHLVEYESALDAFLKGQWSVAYERLHHVPPQDLGKDLLTGFIIQHNHTPPPDWDGVITLGSKS